jgi:hypothetical protein
MVRPRRGIGESVPGFVDRSRPLMEKRGCDDLRKPSEMCFHHLGYSYNQPSFFIGLVRPNRIFEMAANESVFRGEPGPPGPPK